VKHRAKRKNILVFVSNVEGLGQQSSDNLLIGEVRTQNNAALGILLNSRERQVVNSGWQAQADRQIRRFTPRQSVVRDWQSGSATGLTV
jgi:hypothetical protein